MFHVLLVEDNPSDVMLIREGMRRSDIPADVVIADNGEDGLQRLLESRFDLVILDLNIPRLHGQAFLGQHFLLGRRFDQRVPPVHVFSGSENPKDKQSALALGATGYTVKPLDFEEYIEAVDGILRHMKTTAA